MARYITVNEAAHCVMARVRRHHQLYQENFTLRQYGSYAKAERAAQKWVRACLEALPEPLSAKDRKTARNTSGVVGVRLANATRRKSGKVYPDWRWIAFWAGCPLTGGLGWSVNKYGDERAFVLAYLARQAQTVEREALETVCQELRGTAEYRRIVRLKKLSPP